MSWNLHQDCPYAANPYHECNHRCLEKMSTIVVDDVSSTNKAKKPFLFGKLLWRNESPPISPAARGNKLPFSSYFAKKTVESDDSSSEDTFNSNLFRPRSPPHGNKPVSEKNQLIATSSLAGYCKKESFAFTIDNRELQVPIQYDGVDNEMSPRTRPKTPEHPLKTHQHSPFTSDSRPRTPKHSTLAPGSRPRIPEHGYNATQNSIASETRHKTNLEHEPVAIGPKPKEPDTRPRTEERRARSPGGYRERSSRQRSKTPEPQRKYHEPLRPKTPETKAKTEEYRERPPDHRARNPKPRPRVLKTQELGQVNESEEDNGSVSLYLEIRSIFEAEEEETQSIITSDSYVSVGSYMVKANVSATLKQIFDKHGDIASGSKLESMTTRSYFLETLAEVVLELKSTPLKKIKVTRVLEMLAIVEDVESVKIRGGWLREILNEILDASRHYDQYKTMVMEKKKWEQNTMMRRQEMETVLTELRVKEKEAMKLRDGLTKTAGRLGELEKKEARLEKRMVFLSSKVGKFQGGSTLVKMR